MNHLLLAIKLGWREWCAGKWTLLFLALVLAVTAFTGQYFFTDRFTKSLHQQASILLGGDLVISSPTPIPQEWITQADKNNVRHAQVWAFPTMGTYQNHFQLVYVQAVSSNFPLLGVNQGQHPEPGTVWVDSRLLNELGPSPKKLRIGVATFTVTEPKDWDWENIFGLSFAPRVVMNLSDVPQTQTIIPGSRVEYRLLLTGDAAAIKNYRQFLKPELREDQRFIDLNNQSIPAKDILINANYYLSLAIVGCLLMACAALILSANHYVEQQRSTVGLLRCLGLRRKQLMQLFFLQLFIITGLASVLGILLGYGLHLIFIKLISQWIPLNLSRPSWLPAATGFAVAIIFIGVFVLPSFIKLSGIGSITIWRSEVEKNLRFSLLNLIALVIVTFLILYILIQNIKFVFWIMEGLLLIVAITYLLLNVWFSLSQHLAEKLSGAWRHGFLNTLRFDNNIRLQTISFAIVIMAIVLLYNLRADLLINWQMQLPTNTPNYFVINIAPQQEVEFKKALLNMNVKQSDLYPIVRGRLIALNAKPILSAIPPSAKNNNALNRELNLSWMRQIPYGNKIVAGRWWDSKDIDKNLISLEESLANDLHIVLGDRLTFQIADQEVSGTVANIRQLRWESFHPNFYVIFSPQAINAFPKTYITSFYLPFSEKQQLNKLVMQFPNITIIDAANLLQQLIAIFKQATNALQYTFLLALIAGIIILWANMETSLQSREESYRIMRILGASSRYVRNSLLIEFLVTGILAGLLGTLIANLISFVAASYFFNIHYHFSMRSWVVGIAIGVFFVSIPALWFSRHILKIPPLLRE
jgi:putative ABC transport system permease protein